MAENKSASIIREGLRDRRHDVTGWFCPECKKPTAMLNVKGGCPNCDGVNLQPAKSKERLHAETEAMKDKQRFHYWQEGTYNPQSWESQLGQALTAQQVLGVLQKWIPGTKMFPQFNKHLGKTLAAYYVPWRWTEEEKTYISETEKKANLKFVCCGEMGIMPEWDVLPLDADGKSLPQIRGWRSIVGIFYRAGHIPFIPDEGTRLGWWQIKESPLRRN